MPLQHLKVSREFILALHGVDATVRARCYRTAEGIAEGYPVLPGAGDVAVEVDRVGIRWARYADSPVFKKSLLSPTEFTRMVAVFLGCN